MLGKDYLAKQVSRRQETHLGRCAYMLRQVKFCLAVSYSCLTSNFKEWGVRSTGEQN